MSNNRIKYNHAMLVNAPLVNISANCSVVRTYQVESEVPTSMLSNSQSNQHGECEKRAWTWGYVI